MVPFHCFKFEENVGKKIQSTHENLVEILILVYMWVHIFCMHTLASRYWDSCEIPVEYGVEN